MDPCLLMSTNLNLHFIDYIHSAGCTHCVDRNVVAVTVLLSISTLLIVVVLMAIPILWRAVLLPLVTTRPIPRIAVTAIRKPG